MRQHGNDPVHQIYAGATLQGFPVQRRILLYIITHICNVYPKPIPSRLVQIQTDCIVQILGILTVDGHHLQPGQVQTPLSIRLLHLFRHPIRLMHNLLPKLHG